MGRRRNAATFAFLAALPLLTGCDNCNILGRMSTGCSVALGAGAILAAPILIPALLIDEAETASARRAPASAPAQPMAAFTGIKDQGVSP